jgi:hypothetical protein
MGNSRSGMTPPNYSNQANNAITSQAPNGPTQTTPSFKAGRVKNIVLEESNAKFNEFGGWNALGYIEYQDIVTPTEIYSRAKPFFANIKNLPLLDEIVWIVSLPNTDLNGIPNASGNATPGLTTATSEYYICPTSFWNHPHHNGFPANPQTLPESQQKDYLQTQAGNVRRVTDQSTNIDLGNTFIERSNIHPLKPFEGDIITEGRWGNSIRFGSTIKVKPPFNTSLNNWSTGTSTSGDPIIIIRNGQGTQTEEGWIPIVEDINNDEASIYFTSTQKIPLKASSTLYDSYRTAPTTPDQYAGKQILINSGRLVFNSTTDHILFSSAQTVGFNAVKGFNFDTKANFVVSAPSIKLGSKNATEPLLLGNKTVSLLNSLIVNLKTWMEFASPAFANTPGGAQQMSIISSNLVTILTGLEQNLSGVKSKNNFTI